MKHLSICTLLIAPALCLLRAQPPPPTPPDAVTAGSMQSVSGTISQLNYGPDGQLNGFVCSNNMLIQVPKEWAFRLEGNARAGQVIKVSGYSTLAPSGMQVMDPQTLSIGGRTFSNTQPSGPAPYAGHAVIKQLNYGRGGEVNGFVCSSGLFATTPPFGAGNDSVLKPGAEISFSGFAHTAPFGKTVIDVQSITVNGQTITFDNRPVPPPPLDAAAVPRGPRRRAATPPPPPPGAQP